MRAPDTAPTGVERTFSDDEIIVTKTDPKGIIRYANDLFLRMSAMQEGDALGKPHSVIRHPDMPRGVFALLWDRIQAKDEIFAYVKNLALDGAHYWVLAHVTPSFGPGGEIVGYHSNRRTPDRSALPTVSALYDRMLAEERRHARPADAIVASRSLLEQFVAEHASSYDELVWTLESRQAGVR